jgi:hypothetical protein
MRAGTNRSPISVFLLSIVTCGIYYFYWLYTTSVEMAACLGEEDIPPIVDLLLIIFTGSLWGFVWDWRTGQKIARMQERVGLPRNDESVLYLVLDALGVGPVYGLGMIVPILQQTRLNEVYDRIRTGIIAEGGGYVR